MLKIEKIKKTDLELEVSGQACPTDDCLNDCERVSWTGNKSASQGCVKVITCNSWITTSQ